MSSLQEFMCKERGLFNETLSYSLHNKASTPSQFHIDTITISSHGALTALTAQTVLIHRLHSCQIRLLDTEGSIHVVSFDKDEQVTLKAADMEQFQKLIGSLILWHSLKPKGISSKRLAIPFKQNDNEENLLVASCKIFGYAPPKMKNLGLLSNGPKVTLLENHDKSSTEDYCWFSAMVSLKSSGVLELINESDGQSIYSMDITKLRKEEIRELHHSLFESSNYLYVGLIEKLRESEQSSGYWNDSSQNSLSAEYPTKATSIILEFPYRIDVEDWLVALTSFSIKECVGIDKSNSLRVSKRVQIGILEAAYVPNDPPSKLCSLGLYAEIQIWEKPWFRTAIVHQSVNPFFRETFELDVPIETSRIVILLKNSRDLTTCQITDDVLGRSVIEFRNTFTQTTSHEKVPIYLETLVVGQFDISLKTSKNYILPAENFNNLETMILNLNFSELYDFIIRQTTKMDLETVSVILLDIFQSLQKENDWFNALIEQEVKNSLARESNSDIYSTLFRGNSILTKSLELYNLRIGQEYLEKVIGNFINSLIATFKPIEIDPMRIRADSVSEKEAILETNYKNLLKLTNELWRRIYYSSNDLPIQIKTQLSYLRKTIELYSTDETNSLNSITAFIFLRFFCPVILNPKLFFLTKNHQFGEVKRCLTLLSKIIMKLANRQEFDAKEPYMMRFNTEFLQKHKSELVDYLDKITLKKLDFTEKHFKLSTNLERTELPLPNSDYKDLLTVPFLIDKYLRIDELVDIITYDPNKKIDQEQELDPTEDENDFSDDEHNMAGGSNSIGEALDKSYTIGSLEFEKIVLENHIEKDESEFGSENFIKTLLNTDSSDEVFHYINSNSSLKDLIIESTRLLNKRERLIKKLSSAENFDSLVQSPENVAFLLSQTVLDPQRNIYKLSPYFKTQPHRNLRTLDKDSTLNSLKIKIISSPPSSESSSSIRNHLQSPSKRLGQMIRSASINTLSSISAVSEKASPLKKKGRKWFKK